jgi:hypothetical protein
VPADLWAVDDDGLQVLGEVAELAECRQELEVLVEPVARVGRLYDPARAALLGLGDDPQLHAVALGVSPQASRSAVL